MGAPGYVAAPWEASGRWIAPAAGPGPAQLVLLSLGLGFVVAGAIVPFGANEAGCFDHCAEAHRYFVWNPVDNPGAPFLAVGIAGMVATCWRRPRTRPRRWATAVCGWFGVFVTLMISPAMIDELALYGAPSMEPEGGGVLVSAGYVLLFLAAVPVLFGLRRANARPHRGAGDAPPVSR